MTTNETYRSYQRQRYLYFWLAIIVYFVPYLIATACLLPVMKTSEGKKWAIGIVVMALNAIPFLTGIFKGFRSKFPFVNIISFVFVSLAGFFTLDLFSDYVYSFLTIEAVALAGSIAACVLWYFHNKYKRKAQTVSDVIKSGILDEQKKEEPHVEG